MLFWDIFRFRCILRGGLTFVKTRPSSDLSLCAGSVIVKIVNLLHYDYENILLSGAAITLGGGPAPVGC